MKYPKEYLDEIKTRLKVSTVVSKTVSLKKRGKEFVGLSPFKKSIMHFQFLDKDFWNIIDDKKKRVPIIQTIYDIIIDKGYFKKDINDDKFKKLKLKMIMV